MNIHTKSFAIIGFLILIQACKNKPPSSLESNLNLTKTSSVFNLASYIRRNPKTSDLLPYIAPGDPYLFFGSRDKFRLETNLTIEATAEPGFIGDTRGIRAAYWLDGIVFGQKIGKSSKGYLVDAIATASLDPVQADALIRIGGNDKYRGKLEATFQQSFMRDLQIDAINYAVPLLGITAGGVVGGEISFKVTLGARKDGTLGLSFHPQGILNGTLQNTNGASKFSTVEAVGEVMLLNLDLASTANIGLWPTKNFAYGSIGVDAGELRSLSGKLEIVAKVGVNQTLPSGVDSKLWQRVESALGLSGLEWRHLVWQPKQLYHAEVPAFSQSFLRFVPNANTCQESKREVLKKLEIHSNILQQEIVLAEPGLNRTALNTSRLNLMEIQRELQAYCK